MNLRKERADVEKMSNNNLAKELILFNDKNSYKDLIMAEAIARILVRKR